MTLSNFKLRFRCRLVPPVDLPVSRKAECPKWLLYRNFPKTEKSVCPANTRRGAATACNIPLAVSHDERAVLIAVGGSRQPLTSHI
jgi:hypothetical protein